MTTVPTPTPTPEFIDRENQPDFQGNVIDTPTPEPKAHRITADCQPVFPCWVWYDKTSWSRRTCFFAGEDVSSITHWHPDAARAQEGPASVRCRASSTD